MQKLLFTRRKNISFPQELGSRLHYNVSLTAFVWFKSNKLVIRSYCFPFLWAKSIHNLILLIIIISHWKKPSFPKWIVWEQ